MGVPRRLVSLPEQETHFDSLPLRDQTKKHILKWLRVQDQKRPRRVAPTCLLSSLRGKFRSSKRPSVSWMLIRMASCPPRTSSRPSTPLVNPFPTVKPKACLAKPQAQSISHKWSCFSQKRWPEALMMTIPSLRLSKSTAKSTQKCSDTPSLLSVTNSQTPKSTTPTVNFSSKKTHPNNNSKILSPR